MTSQNSWYLSMFPSPSQNLAKDWQQLKNGEPTASSSQIYDAHCAMCITKSLPSKLKGMLAVICKDERDMMLVQLFVLQI